MELARVVIVSKTRAACSAVTHNDVELASLFEVVLLL